MSDPTPTPAAPDWRELCSIAIELWDADCDMESVVSQMRAALVTIPPDAPPDDARIESLRTALREVIDACGGLATADVSDEFLCLAPGEVRSQLAKARRGTPPAPTREALAHDDVLILAAIIRNIRPWVQAPEPLAEAILSHPSWSKLLPPAAPTSEAAPAPVPRQGAEISDEELAEMAFAAGMEGIEVVDDKGWERLLLQAWEYELIAFARVVWARAQALPAADQQEGRDNTDGRDPACVAQWPDCEDGAYDPRCCRFPKSCSCGPRGAGRVQP